MPECKDVLMDTEYLNAYTSGDTDLQVHVLQIFLENIPVYMSALSRENNSEWKRDAHKLKGAARSVGAKRIANLAEQAEKMGAVTNAENQVSILKKLYAAVNETKAFIEVNYLQDKVLY